MQEALSAAVSSAALKFLLTKGRRNGFGYFKERLDSTSVPNREYCQGIHSGSEKTRFLAIQAVRFIFSKRLSNQKRIGVRYSKREHRKNFHRWWGGTFWFSVDCTLYLGHRIVPTWGACTEDSVETAGNETSVSWSCNLTTFSFNSCRWWATSFFKCEDKSWREGLWAMLNHQETR